MIVREVHLLPQNRCDWHTGGTGAFTIAATGAAVIGGVQRSVFVERPLIDVLHYDRDVVGGDELGDSSTHDSGTEYRHLLCGTRCIHDVLG